MKTAMNSAEAEEVRSISKETMEQLEKQLKEFSGTAKEEKEKITPKCIAGKS
ncbi:MAG: hypothetical protein LBB11_01040 [Puniceicoccales bacterium]|jgi:hypothetical protein|nr:hypothetical protein [Puniceicoccales bacterium]